MATMVRAEHLVKWFPKRTGAFSLRKEEADHVKAVDNVSFDIDRGEVFGLVGESGCGKTTTGRLMTRLLEPTGGTVHFDGRDLYKVRRGELKEFRRRMQIIFQDPYESLNPRKTIYDALAEPIRIHGLDGEVERIMTVTKEVQLTPFSDILHRYPHELSGGQRQRVAIARALILEPRFIVADEPVSMLDVSIRTDILNLMLDLKERFGLTYLFITHDLAVAKYMCDRIGVMYLGKLVEVAESQELTEDPLHPYTKALLSAVPSPDPRVRIGDIPIKGEVTSAPRAGCIFEPRCPIAEERCRRIEPPLREVRRDRLAACHLVA